MLASQKRGVRVAVTNRAVREGNVTATGYLPRFPATDSCSHLNLPFRRSLFEQRAANASTICRWGRSEQSGDRAWTPGVGRRRSAPSVGTASPYKANYCALSVSETPGNPSIFSPEPRAAPGAPISSPPMGSPTVPCERISYVPPTHRTLANRPAYYLALWGEQIGVYKMASCGHVGPDLSSAPMRLLTQAGRDGDRLYGCPITCDTFPCPGMFAPSRAQCGCPRQTFCHYMTNFTAPGRGRSLAAGAGGLDPSRGDPAVRV